MWGTSSVNAKDEYDIGSRFGIRALRTWCDPGGASTASFIVTDIHLPSQYFDTAACLPTTTPSAPSSRITKCGWAGHAAFTAANVSPSSGCLLRFGREQG
jgi:hypothetical protein